MKKQTLLSAIALTISAVVYAQTPVRPPIAKELHPLLRSINKQPAGSLGPGVWPGNHTIGQRPSAVKERCVLLTYLQNGTTSDSIFMLYSNGRGSNTGDNGEFLYYSYTSFDTSYFRNWNDGFRSLKPSGSGTFNSSSNHPLTFTDYYENNRIYRHRVFTWNPADTYQEHINIREYYPFGSTNSSDSFYQGTALHPDGWGLRDTMILNYSLHDPTLKSNYVWTSELNLDSLGRPGFQRRQNTTITNIIIDSVARVWASPTSKNIIKEIIDVTNINLATKDTTTEQWVYEWRYNSAGLTDSILLSLDGKPVSIETADYSGKIMTSYTTLNWDTVRNKYTEAEKTICTINEAGMWDTVKLYKDGKLSAMTTSTFTSYNNIKTRTTYDYNKAAQTVSNYFYEEYDPTGIKDNWNNIKATIFPNPMTNGFYMHIDEAATSDMNLVIADLSGRLMLQQKITDPLTMVPASDLSPGIYIVHVAGKDHAKRFTSKIIKN